MLVSLGVTRRQNGDAQALIEGLDLTADERRSLLALEGDRGFALTCHVVRWWRTFRTKGAAPLTTVQLSTKAEDYISEYISSSSFSSFFFIEEAIAFLDHLLTRHEPNPTTRAVALFEKALLRANAERETTLAGGEIKRSRKAPRAILSERYCAPDNVSVVTFDRPAEVLLGALLAGQPAEPVAEHEEHPIVVSPRLEILWRPATSSEARLVSTLRTPMLLAEALARSGASLDDARTLLADSLLVKAPTKASGHSNKIRSTSRGVASQ